MDVKRKKTVGLLRGKKLKTLHRKTFNLRVAQRDKQGVGEWGRVGGGECAEEEGMRNGNMPGTGNVSKERMK